MERAVLLSIFKDAGLSDENFDSVINAFNKIHLKKKDYFLQEGQTSQAYCFIEKGLMRSFATDTEGNDITTGFYTKGDMVLEAASFFLKIPTRENIQALTDCTVWRLGFDEFQELFHNIEAFRENGRACLVSGYFALKRRSISMITDSAQDRYLQLLKESPEVVQQVPLKHIASYLGITDTSLSRIRRDITQQ